MGYTVNGFLLVNPVNHASRKEGTVNLFLVGLTHQGLIMGSVGSGEREKLIINSSWESCFFTPVNSLSFEDK